MPANLSTAQLLEAWRQAERAASAAKQASEAAQTAARAAEAAAEAARIAAQDAGLTLEAANVATEAARRTYRSRQDSLPKGSIADPRAWQDDGAATNAAER